MIIFIFLSLIQYTNDFIFYFLVFIVVVVLVKFESKFLI